jgi:hypothetical protein
MTEHEKVKIQQSLVFETSELWNSVILILDATIESEVGAAIGNHTSESNRAHSCGRADGVKFVKELLLDTRTEAMTNAGRKVT